MSRPLAANFCFWTAIESIGEGKLAASEDEEILPSRLPVGTPQLGPLLCIFLKQNELYYQFKKK